MDSSTRNLYDMIQRMIELDGTEKEKQQLDEMVSMNVSMSGETADEVAALAKLIGNAGMGEPEAQGAETLPMRQDMERLAGIMGGGDEPSGEMPSDAGKDVVTASQNLDEWSREDASELEQLYGKAVEAMKGDKRAAQMFVSHINKNYEGVDGARFLKKVSKMDKRDQTRVIQQLIRDNRKGDEDEVGSSDQGIRRNELQFSGYDNEPDADYQDSEYMTKDLSGGLNRRKGAYVDAEDGDNPMAVESIKDQLYARLSEKKAKPDFADIDDDGDTKEPMKKAAKDKKKDKK